MSNSSAAPASRPRPAILAALGVAVAGLLAYSLWPAARQPAAPSNPPREQRRQASAKGAVDSPESLQVQLDALKQAPPSPDDETARNPFRFYVKPPPPPPPPPKVPGPGERGYVPPAPITPQLPPPPLGPPPIPLKFFLVVEKNGKKYAVFQTEKQGLPIWAAEGETILGQYVVVKIGTESVTVKYLDGRGGPQTIPLRGGVGT
jgi:hypothetical protein